MKNPYSNELTVVRVRNGNGKVRWLVETVSTVSVLDVLNVEAFKLYRSERAARRALERRERRRRDQTWKVGGFEVSDSNVEVVILTEEEVQDKIDAITAEHPESVTRYWQLMADPDQCTCCIVAEIALEFGVDAWDWVPDLEKWVWLLGMDRDPEKSYDLDGFLGSLDGEEDVK